MKPEVKYAEPADPAATTPLSTRALYQSLRDSRGRDADNLERRSATLAVARLLVFLCGLALGLAAWVWQLVPPGVVLLPLVLFVSLIIIHDRHIAAIARVRLARDHFAAGLARIDHRWPGTGITGLSQLPEAHPYALDLDIFGEGSLYELLCTARTSSGEHCLAQWLQRPAPREEILARQAAVTELKDRVALREEMDLRARAMRSLGDSERLNRWAKTGEHVDAATEKRLRLLFSALGAAAVAALVSVFLFDFGLAILAAVAITEWIVGRVYRQRIDALTLAVEGPRSEMKALADVLARVEEEDMTAPLLREIANGLATPVRASAAIASLARIADWLDQYRNQVFAPIGFLLMWRGQFALSIAAWKRMHGAHVTGWLNNLGRFEAILALSTFAFEHEDAVLPQIVAEEEGPLLAGVAMRHPLMPEDGCVPNSVHLDGRCQLWVVSGSNMSGKSTFLRVIGVNTVLAMAGAPVLAQSLRISPLHVGATIRVLDSLQQGKSRFYAEISALKDIVSLARGDVPLLFLLDEIFHGTNSHDRRVGAEAIVRQLLSMGAIGLLTTHDLVLARAAEGLGEAAKNVHFEDSVLDGELHFDYLLKNGVVEKSNALLLMRKVGLDV